MEISASELKSRLAANNDLVVVDVREELEFCTFNIGGINIPLGKLTDAEDFTFTRNDELVVICQRGIRSRTACKILTRKGFTRVKNLTGGLLALQRINN